MFHPYTDNITFDKSEWWIFDLEFTKNISYKDYPQKASIKAIFKISKGKKHEIIKDMDIYVTSGCLWDRDAFHAGERARALIHMTQYDSIKSCCALFAMSERPHPTEKDRLLKLLSLDESMQKHAYFFSLSNGDVNKLSSGPYFSDAADIKTYYKVVSSSLTSEQRLVCETWLKKCAGNDRRKLDYFLGISPNAHDRVEVSFEEIMEVFDSKIVGREKIKKTIARELANRQKLSKRGMVILLHGLPGTGKTHFGKVIAEAIKRPYKKINLASVSRTAFLIGSESTYSDSDAGVLVKTSRANGTSELVFGFDEFGSLLDPNQNTGTDGNVSEIFLSLLDPSGRYLSDNFLEGIPVDFNNAVFVLTANRLNDIQPEILNRMDLILDVAPTDDQDLVEILQRKSLDIARKQGLRPDWVGDEVLAEMIRYRGDFGARDALSYLNFMASKLLDAPDTSKAKYDLNMLQDDLSEIVDFNDPAVIFHLNREKYSEIQVRAILDAFSRKGSGSHMSDHDKLMLNKEINYLTKLIPNMEYTFSPEDFFTSISKKVHGMDAAAEEIAAELYAALKMGSVPTPILLDGAPGTGKTTMAEAIAKGCGRAFVRIQLNGTSVMGIKGAFQQYKGADAGLIVTKMAEAYTSSPVLFLDELDKCSHDVAMSLLDLLDGGKFYDNFLSGIPIDVKNCVFVASCNDLAAIDPVLRSRFRVCHISGYSADEKSKIAESYIIPELIGSNNISFDESALKSLVSRHSAEAGIRELKHDIYSLVKRRLLKDRNNEKEIIIDSNDVDTVLGGGPYTYIADDMPGCINGLAVMGYKGVVMPISITPLKDEKKRITGMPKDAILDSISIAETWIEGLGYDIKGYHINFTPGGIPKDGPSAGLAIAMAMYSCVTGKTFSGAAFTGEFDGRHILPVGGVDLKIQAAMKAGLKRVFIPSACEHDVISGEDIEVIPVDTIEEVIRQLEYTRV